MNGRRVLVAAASGRIGAAVAEALARSGWWVVAGGQFGPRALADAKRAEESGHGVHVTTFDPGRTDTPVQRAVFAAGGRPYGATGLGSPPGPSPRPCGWRWRRPRPGSRATSRSARVERPAAAGGATLAR